VELEEENDVNVSEAKVKITEVKDIVINLQTLE